MNDNSKSHTDVNNKRYGKTRSTDVLDDYTKSAIEEAVQYTLALAVPTNFIYDPKFTSYRARVCANLVNATLPDMISPELLPLACPHCCTVIQLEFVGKNKVIRRYGKFERCYSVFGDIKYTPPYPLPEAININEDDPSKTDVDWDSVCANLQNKMDALIIGKLLDIAPTNTAITWNLHPDDNESMVEHYISLNTFLADASSAFYNQLEFAYPNYLLIPISMIDALRFADGFEEADSHALDGFYYLGHIDTLKIYVVPIIEDGSCVFGFQSAEGYCIPGCLRPSYPITGGSDAIADNMLFVDKLHADWYIGISNPQFLMKCKVIGAERNGVQ